MEFCAGKLLDLTQLEAKKSLRVFLWTLPNCGTQLDSHLLQTLDLEIDNSYEVTTLALHRDLWNIFQFHILYTNNAVWLKFGISRIHQLESSVTK